MSLDVRGCSLTPERFMCLDACTHLSTLFCDIAITLRGGILRSQMEEIDSIECEANNMFMAF
jgi:hypothetical protein